MIKKAFLVIVFIVLYGSGIAQQKHYVCVSDSIFLNYLNTQDSYYFRFNPNDWADSLTTFKQSCFSTATKQRIIALLNGVDSDFKEEIATELKRVKPTFITTAKVIVADDTTKNFQIVLDSLLTSLIKEHTEYFRQQSRYSNDIRHLSYITA